MKRIIAAILCIIMLSICAVTAFAVTATIDTRHSWNHTEYTEYISKSTFSARNGSQRNLLFGIEQDLIISSEILVKHLPILLLGMLKAEPLCNMK